MQSMRAVLSDPRTVGVAQAAPRTAAFLAKSWMTSRFSGSSETSRPTVGLAAQVFLDEVLIAAMKNPRLFPTDDDYRRAGNDIADGHRMWDERGWLQQPARYHRDPEAPIGAMVTRERALNLSYEHLTFPSQYEPHFGEPGRLRWLSYDDNRTAHAWVFRHREPGRPWLVCVHGWGMGSSPLMDQRAFRAKRLRNELGLNVLLPVLPLHGARQRPEANAGEGFMSIDLIDAVHGFAQAACDVRTAIRWIRFHDGHDVPVGVYGLSLGGYVAALTAGLEDDLACVIAGIPATDLVDLYRRHSPPGVRRQARASGAIGPEASAVHRVVSPLALEPKPAKDRRFLFAGIGDRMSTAAQARRLWEHWDRPQMAWYPGGHVGFFWASSVNQFVDEALLSTGLVSRFEPGVAPRALPAG
jgi:pimeloyl-ACP methyl ester carboxylesterase